MRVDDAAPPPVSMRSKRAPFMDSMKRSFFSSRTRRSSWTQPGSSKVRRIRAWVSMRQAACCQQPAWSPQTKPRRMPLSPTAS